MLDSNSRLPNTLPGPLPIIEATEAEATQYPIGGRLREFNAGFVGEYQVIPLWLRAFDAAGVLRGGLNAEISRSWLMVHVLWIEESVRGQGLGRRILRQAEALASERGVSGVWLNTFEFQAPGFYAKEGYTQFGQIDDYAPGYFLSFWKKAF